MADLLQTLWTICEYMKTQKIKENQGFRENRHKFRAFNRSPTIAPNQNHCPQYCPQSS